MGELEEMVARAKAESLKTLEAERKLRKKLAADLKRAQSESQKSEAALVELRKASTPNEEDKDSQGPSDGFREVKSAKKIKEEKKEKKHKGKPEAILKDGSREIVSPVSYTIVSEEGRQVNACVVDMGGEQKMFTVAHVSTKVLAGNQDTVKVTLPTKQPTFECILKQLKPGLDLAYLELNVRDKALKAYPLYTSSIAPKRIYLGGAVVGREDFREVRVKGLRTCNSENEVEFFRATSPDDYEHTIVLYKINTEPSWCGKLVLTESGQAYAMHIAGNVPYENARWNVGIVLNPTVFQVAPTRQ
jgi:hypothetical protein